jgi:hypothetical protein
MGFNAQHSKKRHPLCAARFRPATAQHCGMLACPAGRQPSSFVAHRTSIYRVDCLEGSCICRVARCVQTFDTVLSVRRHEQWEDAGPFKPGEVQ